MKGHTMTYSISAKEANEIATQIIAQTPYAPVDYLVEASLKGFFGPNIISVLECADDYSEELEDALNAQGAIEYHVKELLNK